MKVSAPEESVRPKTAEEQQRTAWGLLRRPKAPDSKTGSPTIAEVSNDVRNNNFEEIFSLRSDVKSSPKMLCANGVMCTFRIEWFGLSGYTGMFKKADHGIMRLSSALGDISGSLPAFAGKIGESKLFPCVALKLFRGGNKDSVNLVLGGKKTSQPEWNFFEHSVCSNLTEKVSFWLRWVLAIFRLYSKFPTQSGLSELALVDQDGEDVTEAISFPWCLLLRPAYDLSSTRAAADIGPEGEMATSSADLPIWMNQLLRIPVNTTLYDIYAVPTPSIGLAVLNAGSSEYADFDNSSIQRLGRLITTSSCVWSEYDRYVFFRHQRKEEDYALRPEWEEELCIGHNNVGAADIDRLINAGKFLDLENS